MTAKGSGINQAIIIMGSTCSRFDPKLKPLLLRGRKNETANAPEPNNLRQSASRFNK
jgi:hypothetical protein